MRSLLLGDNLSPNNLTMPLDEMMSERRHLVATEVDTESRVQYVARLKKGFSTTQPLRGGELRVIKAWLAVRTKMKSDTDAFFISERRKPLSRKTVWQAIRTYDARARATA